MHPSDGAELRIEFCGEEYSATPGTVLTFGRSADIIIDENRFLHRVLGEFRHVNGLWWLSNVGRSIALTLQDDTGPSMARLAPGIAMPVTFETSTLRFEAGGTSYELTIDAVTPLRAGADDDELDDGPEDDDESAMAELTTSTNDLPLNVDQFALLVALATPLLHNESALPTNRHLAETLGWTVTKYNRKLDGLCKKFGSAGVSGLHGSTDRLAKDRRVRLAEHVVHSRIIRIEHVDATSDEAHEH